MARNANPAFLKSRLESLWAKLECPSAMFTVREIVTVSKVFTPTGKPIEPLNMDYLELLEATVSRVYRKSDKIRKAIRDI